MSDQSLEKQFIEIEGTVAAVMKGTLFRVKLDNGHIVLAHISGKIRKHFIRLAVGDRVRMEISKYDPGKGRIIYRCSTNTSTNTGTSSSHHRR